MMATEPLILHIETATEVCSVCISKGDSLVAVCEAEGPNEHSRVITLLIEKCLHDACTELGELDAVALSSGPGSYTSLRVGTSAAKGICYALEKPLLVVDTLRSLALAALLTEKDDEALYCPMIDARRMDVYTRLFDGANQPVSEMKAATINSGSYSNYFEAGRSIVFCGNGAEKCSSLLSLSPLSRFSPVAACSSKFMIPLALEAFMAEAWSDPAYYTPLYFKSPNITISRKKPF